MMICILLLITLLSPSIALLLTLTYYKLTYKRSKKDESQQKIIAFYHPNCAAGGGGERVLFQILSILEQRGGACSYNNEEDYKIVIYSTSTRNINKMDFISDVRRRFHIEIIGERLDIMYLPPVQVKGSLLRQSCQTTSLAYQFLKKTFIDYSCVPHIYFDTTGCAFSLFIAKALFGVSKVCTYIHYPTVSRDMLSLVWERRKLYMNDDSIASSQAKSYIKCVYYIFFALLYGFFGSIATDCVMVNSTWTYRHIRELFFAMNQKNIYIVYPPCDTAELERLPLKSSERDSLIISIGQFRPEKDHALQIRAFHLFLKRTKKEDVKLMLIGSCRNIEDEKRVTSLKALCEDLGVSHAVEFIINQPFPILKELMGRASVGIHSMWNEHFGIGVVEMMSAGLITIAHDSGGPKSDIIVPKNKVGYLASSLEEYASVISQVFDETSPCDVQKIREASRCAAKRFSNEVFIASFERVMEKSCTF